MRDLFLLQLPETTLIVDSQKNPVMCPFRVPVLLPVQGSRFQAGPPEAQINTPICSDQCIFHHLQETKEGGVLTVDCTGTSKIFNVKKWK